MSSMADVAGFIENNTQMFAYTIQNTPADKIVWKAKAEGQTSEARSMLDMAQECIGLNASFVGQFSGHPMAPPTATVENVVELLIASGKLTADVVRQLTPEQLATKYDLGWAQLTGDFMTRILFMHPSYHNGQANFIQTLYGDMEFHVPPGMLD